MLAGTGYAATHSYSSSATTFMLPVNCAALTADWAKYSNFSPAISLPLDEVEAHKTTLSSLLQLTVRQSSPRTARVSTAAAPSASASNPTETGSSYRAVRVSATSLATSMTAVLRTPRTSSSRFSEQAAKPMRSNKTYVGLNRI